MKPSTKRKIFIGLAAPLGVALFALLFWRLPWWLDGSHLRNGNLQPADGVIITGVRTGLVALGAAFVAGLGLFYTHGTLRHTRERDREQADLTREGQVTDRYIEAIKLLAEKDSMRRLGGIYALERIMKDSEKDHSTVVEVLASFVRDHSPVRTPPKNPKGPVAADTYGNMRPNGAIQAALTVLGRRPIRHEKYRIDLRNVDLRGADLAGAYLVGADFTGSDLRGADFSASHMHGVNLRETRLDGAHFIESLMDGCFLDECQGLDVNFNCAILRGASFGESNLSMVNLSGADLWASRWIGTTFHGADFDSTDLRFATFINSTLQGSTFKGATLSLTQVVGSDYPECDFQGIDLDGSIFISGDLSEAIIADSKAFENAALNPEVKLPESISSDPLIADRVQAYEQLKSVPIWRIETEKPPCCSDDSTLSHTVGLMNTIPDENERNLIVSQAMQSMAQS
ncbi:pentapeptide repeat-containing protein [Streptomyces sp. NPDC056400]|uniref:pentapeptide repeat-containing protein n=1 Tax=Streptomyces sp. NPDC056400 TaxID=3345808 RepID=UPI0035E055EB